MFQKILTSALFAGFCAGLIAGLLQLVFVQPVLLHAELYEAGKLVHFGPGAVAAAVSADQDAGGIRVLGFGHILMASWLLKYDIARKTIKKDGLPRFVASSTCNPAWYR